MAEDFIASADAQEEVFQAGYFPGPCGVAMVTPFNSDGEIDYPAAERLLDYLEDSLVDFLVVLGTTGETPTLTPKEQDEYVRFVVEHAWEEANIVVGCSGNCTRDVVRRLETMNYDGVDFILSAVPSYNKPSQRGIALHFAQVAQASEVPVILYNVPGRTGVNMLASTCCELAHTHENIIGVKEASGNLDQILEILRDSPEDFMVFSGDDSLTLPAMSMGADGVISVVGNAAPKLFADMVHKAYAGDTEAQVLNARLLRLYRLLFKEGNPSGVKSALAHLGICDEVLRLPLVPVSDGLRLEIADALKGLGLTGYYGDY